MLAEKVRLSPCCAASHSPRVYRQSSILSFPSEIVAEPWETHTWSDRSSYLVPHPHSSVAARWSPIAAARPTTGRMLKNLLSRTISVLSVSISQHHSVSTQVLRQAARPSLTRVNFCSQRFFSDRRYSEKHEWISLDATDKTIGTVGISSYAQESLGDVVYVQTPDVGARFNQDDEVGAVESVKAANEIYTPVSGTILEVNKTLEEKPGLINSSCYEDGWIFKIKIQDQKEVDGLMDQNAYDNYLKSVNWCNKIHLKINKLA